MKKIVKRPIFDRHGYPTAATLAVIRRWSAKDYCGLVKYIYEAWNDCGQIWYEEDGLLKMATGGWSGNEIIIGALKENLLFWSSCWESSTRGGLHCFRLTSKKKRATLVCLDGGSCNPTARLKKHREAGGQGDPCAGCGG